MCVTEAELNTDTVTQHVNTSFHLAKQLAALQNSMCHWLRVEEFRARVLVCVY